MTDMTVANEILRQLGGRAFLMITGAKDLVGSDDALMMKLPRGAKGNKLVIKLDPSDTYTLTLYNFRNLEMKKIKEVEMVYVDMLLDVFESMTGLYATLGARR